MRCTVLLLLLASQTGVLASGVLSAAEGIGHHGGRDQQQQNNNYNDFLDLSAIEDHAIIDPAAAVDAPSAALHHEVMHASSLRPNKKERSLQQVSCVLGSGSDLYVSSEFGSDTGTGSTAASPFKTIQHAVDQRGACSTIHIMNGIYVNVNPYQPIVDLSGVHGLTIQRHDLDHQPKLQFDGSGAIRCSSSNPCSHLDISGLEIEGPNANITFAEAMVNRNAATTTNRFMGRGIAIWKGNNIHFHHLTVHHCPASGIRVNKGDYITIADCVVHSNAWWSPRAESAIVFAESLHIDTNEDTKMFMLRNTVYDNMNKIPYLNPNYAWDYSPIAVNMNCASFPSCNPDCIGSGCGNILVNCPWQCRYGKASQDYIIDGMGVYVTRNKDTYLFGKMQLSDNVCYGNGINGLVFHRTNRGTVSGNIIYNNGVVPVLSEAPEPFPQDWHVGASGKSRQPYSGLVINNSGDVQLFGNFVASRYDSDFAYTQQFDSGAEPILNAIAGSNIVCRGKVGVAPSNVVARSTDMSLCDPTVVSASPALPPTNSPATTCTPCTDIMNSYGLANEKECPTWTWALDNNCNKNADWISNSYCQYSCFMAGSGYSGDVCCPPTDMPTGAPSVAPTTTLAPSPSPSAAPVTSNPTAKPSTSPPTPDPTGSAAPSACTPCTDIMNPYGLANGKECPTWTWALDNNCNKNADWSSNVYCQYSCFIAGSGYSGDVCCPPTDSPTGVPSLAPTTLAPSLPPSAAPITSNPTAKPSTSPTPDPTSVPSAAQVTSSPTTSPTPDPTAVPSAAPVTSSPTAKPSTSPTPDPTLVPSAAPSACTPCTDIMNPYGLANGKECPTWTWALDNNCNKNADWISNLYCQYSCFIAGTGYNGDGCCPPTDMPTSVPSVAPTTLAPSPPPSAAPVTSSPTPFPTTWAPSRSPSAAPVTTSNPTVVANCIVCDDEPNSYMVLNNKGCSTWAWGIENRCALNPTWTSERVCRYSCYIGGNGYPGDECCL